MTDPITDLREALTKARDATALESADEHDLWSAVSAAIEAVEGAPALQAVVAERRRQIEVEGWTGEHDDTHQRGELAQAAACYAQPEPIYEPRLTVPVGWPWAAEWWKPASHNPRTRALDHTGVGRRRDLVRAGALILAEIERLDRRALRPVQCRGWSLVGRNQGGSP